MPTSVHLGALAPVATVDDEADADILDIFLEEADGLLEALEQASNQLQDDPADEAPQPPNCCGCCTTSKAVPAWPDKNNWVTWPMIWSST